MRNLSEVLMTVAVAVVLLAVWHAAVGAQNIAPRPVSLSGGHVGVLWVSDSDRGTYGRENDSGTWRNGHQNDNDHDPFAPGGVLGHRNPEQHHRDVNRAWGVLGFLLFL